MIPDPTARSAFLAAVTHCSREPAAGAKPDSHPPGAPSSAVAAAPQPAAATTGSGAAGSGLAETDYERIGRILARHIGPLAKILLRREAAKAADLDSLCRALASQIDSAEQRAHFLREAGAGQADRLLRAARKVRKPQPGSWRGAAAPSARRRAIFRA
jgi:serine/threonine-protein kinase